MGLLLLAACAPESYPPPAQRKPLPGFSPNPAGHVVHMNDPDAETHFVRDVSKTLEGGLWRWAYRRPELSFSLSSTENLRFFMDFAIAEATFKDTGPVTISFLVNGNLLDRVRYDRPGEQHFEKPVPSQWLRTDRQTVVAAEPDKVWTSKIDGAQLGFILIRAGFVQ